MTHIPTTDRTRTVADVLTELRDRLNSLERRSPVIAESLIRGC